MVGSDSEQGEANVFFPLGFTDPKPNILSRSTFDKAVEEAGMSDAHFPRYTILDDAAPENPRPVCLARVGEETIFPLQIVVGLLFLYCGISPTQLSRNAIRN